eukprot:m.182901 g.182901  ORF g.182901 m.182901 type:complete len:173 (-) comp25493_c0_seq3:1609-2127(-)
MWAATRRVVSSSRQLCVRHASGLSQAEKEAAVDRWKSISLFAAIPACLFVTYKTFTSDYHPHNFDTFYKYMHVRRKPFPWGDKSLFYNPHLNAHPDDEDEGEHANAPFLTKLIRSWMEDPEDRVAIRDQITQKNKDRADRIVQLKTLPTHLQQRQMSDPILSSDSPATTSGY